MKHLAAFLLLSVAGNTSPSADDVKTVLESVGIEADDDRLEKLLSELKGKDINELISEGSSKLASVPSGGAGGAAAGGAAAAGGGAAAEEKEEEKEEGMALLHIHLPWPYILTCRNRERGVRRRHGLRSLRVSGSYICLRQRSSTISEKWHKNGLGRSCMVSGVEGSASDWSHRNRNRLRYLELAKANTVLLLRLLGVRLHHDGLN
ncbi:60s acidic ribosomal protein-domain-containing protein [Whalleya microplaca]|nr:60s acidic ribosomal protein-domain-containing protein [Whalleya microplaca]